MATKSPAKPQTDAAPESPEQSPEQSAEKSKRTIERANPVAFAVVELTEDAFAPAMGRGNKGRERRDDLKELDEIVQAARISGKPVFLECENSEKVVADLEKNIQNSGRHTNNGIRFGEYIPSKLDGRVYVSFRVTERQVKTKKTAATAQKAAETAPKSETDSATK